METRSYPRSEFHRRALARLADGKIVQVAAHDLSVGGMQVRCDQATALLLYPGQKDIHLHTAPTFEICVSLPFGNQLLAFDALCVAVYLRLVATQRAALGLHFAKLENHSSELLHTFLEDGCASCPPQKNKSNGRKRIIMM